MNAISKIIITLGVWATSLMAIAQANLLTKKVLDDIKPYTFHGAAQLSFEFKKASTYSVQLATGASFLYPTHHHQFRFNSNFVYNLLNSYSNDNRGEIEFNAALNQFYVLADDREKNLWFVYLYAGYNYDYARALHDRATAGINITFQPLREDEHLVLEPSVGLLFSYQNWMVLNTDRSSNANSIHINKYHTISNLSLSDGTTIAEYYGISDLGRKAQIDGRLHLSLNLMGEWDRISFSTYVTVRQPFTPTYKRHNALEAEIHQLVADHIAATESPKAYLPDLQKYCLPEVSFKGHFGVKIWRQLSFNTTLYLSYDGGELSKRAHYLTYGIRQGLSYVW